MSAENLGVKLLGEVHEEPLDQLLSKIRQSLSPYPTSVLGIPRLDRLLETFRFPPPQITPRQQGWKSSGSSNDYSDAEDDTTATPARNATSHQSSKQSSKPAVIEVTSNGSGQGKTSLLYYVAAVSALSQKHGGKETTVVWIDNDGRFSALRLHQLTRHYLMNLKPSETSLDLDTSVREALHHIHIFRPTSPSQLISTLKSLPDLLLSSNAHASHSRTLGLLILDSATTFYWQDRLESEIARLEAGAEEDVSANVSNKVEAIKLLKTLQQQFGCAVLFTSRPTTSGGRPAPGPSPAPDQAVSAWTAFATLTLTLSRQAVQQFASTMTMDECFRDQAQRYQAMLVGKFSATADWEASSGWPHWARQAVENLEGRGGFGFRLTNEGLTID